MNRYRWSSPAQTGTVDAPDLEGAQILLTPRLWPLLKRGWTIERFSKRRPADGVEIGYVHALNSNGKPQTGFAIVLDVERVRRPEPN